MENMTITGKPEAKRKKGDREKICRQTDQAEEEEKRTAVDVIGTKYISMLASDNWCSMSCMFNMTYTKH